MAGPNDNLPDDGMATLVTVTIFEHLNTLLQFGMWKCEDSNADDFAAAQRDFVNLFHLMEAKVQEGMMQFDPAMRARGIANIMRSAHE